jgi:hypothetical protein
MKVGISENLENDLIHWDAYYVANNSKKQFVNIAKKSFKIK